MQPPILIAGAGASGLTLACELHRRRVPCRIIEKNAEPFRGSRGKGLQPRTLEVFDDLGVIDAVTEAGGPFPIFRGYAASKPLWERSLAELLNLAELAPDASAPYTMWMISQSRTEEILRARLAELGGRVESGVELTALSQNDEEVRATLRSGGAEETMRCAYVVGADGGKSFVRSALGISFEGESGEYRSIIADVAIEGLDRGRWHLWLPPENAARVSFCALPGTELFQFSAPVDSFPDEPITLDTLQALFESRVAGLPIRWRELAWSTCYRFNARLAERFRVGRVLLCGDAAHVHSPFGGQGINTSIQDAYNLGWKLALAMRGQTRILESYESERRPVAADVLGLSSGMHRDGYSKSSEGNRDIYQLRVNYRGGPLARDTRARPGRLQAGDRAPDARCALASGKPTRLFDLYRGPHWTILGFGALGANVQTFQRPDVRAFRIGVRSPESDGLTVLDLEGAIAAAYDVPSEALLAVRPDGYVGAVVESADALATYLGETIGA